MLYYVILCYIILYCKDGLMSDAELADFMAATKAYSEMRGKAKVINNKATTNNHNTNATTTTTTTTTTNNNNDDNNNDNDRRAKRTRAVRRPRPALEETSKFPFKASRDRLLIYDLSGLSI